MIDTPIYEILKLWLSILALGGPSLLFLWGCIWVVSHLDVEIQVREIDDDNDVAVNGER